MYGFIGYRRTLRIREFYALLAFLVGICIGFILTTRTRIQIVAPDVEARFSGSQRIVPNKDCTSSGSFKAGDTHERAHQLDSAPDVMLDDHWEPGIHGNGDVLKDDDDESRKLIFVGVMTAQKYLETRAMAVYNTWANHLPGRVVFFAGADAEVPPGLPVVQLNGVDDTYPPQKKSFLMLKYMFEHYGNSYEWFMRADDDVYIRGDRLASFLNSINSSRPQFIGQAGMGNKEEFGQLYLENDENFCMGGPGVVFSRETLRRVAPNVRHCLKNLFSTHEDVEVGRCVRRFAGIPCTWSYEMQSIFYHNSSGDKAFTGDLNHKEIHRAITLHPIKHHSHLYRLHNFMQSLTMHDLRQKILIHCRDIRSMVDVLSGSANFSYATSDSKLVSHKQHKELLRAVYLGKPPSLTKANPTHDNEVVKWDFMQRSIYSHASSNPHRKMEASMSHGLDDVMIEIMDMINKFAKQRGRIIDFKDILYGYHRFDNIHGVDYILDMLLMYRRYRGRKMTLPVRKHVYVQQAFTEMEVSEVALPAGQLSTAASFTSEKINFILPLSGRFHIFQRFMKNFENVCLLTNERVSLTIALFSDNSTNSSFINESIMTLVGEYQKRYVGSEIYVDVMQESFSRAKALQTGSARLPVTSLLFFVDVDIYFTPESLRRIRLNTIYEKQVYFPIVFSQYDPTFHSSDDDASTSTAAQDVPQVSNSFGYWRQFGFGIVSLYHGDLNRTGGLDVTIQGWGKEDVDLYNKIVASNLTVFRAPDPSLIHIFHPVQCDLNLSPVQLKMCLGSRASNYASVHKMANKFYNDPKIWQFANEASVPVAVN